MGLSNNKNVLFFSSDDWKDDLKTSKYHMATCLAQDGYNVLYVNSIGLRKQNLLSKAILPKIISRLSVIFKGVRTINTNLRIFTPFVIPWHSSKLVSGLNRFILINSIKYLKWKYKMANPEVWVFLPNHYDVIGKFKEEFSLYYCVDEHVLFTGVDTDLMRKLEEKLLKKVDLSVVTAMTLFDSKKSHSQNMMYLPHGVNVHHFEQAVSRQLDKPKDISDLKGNIVGFFGLIEDWIDLDLIAFVAKSNPDINLVLIGKISVDITRYTNIKNMIFLGPKKFEELPSYCQYFDCAIMPFKINEMTRHVNPLKMREYLAAGVQVISTALPEASTIKEYVTIAHTPAEFNQQILNALHNKVDRSVISRSVQNDTWTGRYQQLRNKIITLKQLKKS